MSEDLVTTGRTATPSKPSTDRTHRRNDLVLTFVALANLFLIAVMVFADLPRVWVGGLTVPLMLGLMLLRVPIGIALLGTSLLALWRLAGIRPVVSALESTPFASLSSWSLTVIPMFVLMGVALGGSGLTALAYASARTWLGRVPGGLALATNFAGAGLAAGSGSTIGIAHALGRVALPEMMRAGYKPTLATGSVAMAGTLGQIIPPSLLLVIYAGVAETSVGHQLLAGLVPGVILAVGFGGIIVLWAIFDKRAAPLSEVRCTWTEKLRSLTGVTPVAVIVGLVLGGMFFGFFTATEAGAVGGAAALLIGALNVWRASRSGGEVRRFASGAVMETVAATASIFLLLIGVFLLTRVMALSGITRAMAGLVVDLGLSRTAFLLVLIVVYLVLGMFMDTLAVMLLTIPLFMGPLATLDVDMVWFGVFLVILAEIGLVTPPLGVLSFVVYGIASSSLQGSGHSLRLSDVFKGVVPFIAVAIIVLGLMIYIPELATWLPSSGEVE